MVETWRTVEGFWYYEVSDLGRLRTIDRTVKRTLPNGATHMSIAGRAMPGRVRRTKTGRPVAVLVDLYHDGHRRQARLHQIVLESFVGPCPVGLECCHNDGNPLNNTVGNLRWDTHKANLDDMDSHGTRSKPPLRFGSEHHKATLSFDQVLEIRRSHTGRRGDNATLGRRFGVSGQTIRRIVCGLTRVAA